MHLLHALDYSIRIVTPSAPDSVPTCELLISKIPTGKIIHGAILKAALRWNSYTLLFLTDDVPFEETLNIYLLDAESNVIDYARMFFIYSTGIFSDLDLRHPDTVHFLFLGEVIWTLTLFPEKRFALPIISDPRGVRRPFSLFRMFQITAQPLPTTAPSTGLETQHRPSGLAS